MIKDKVIIGADDQSDSGFGNIEIIEIEGEVEIDREGDYLIIRKKMPADVYTVSL